VSRAQTCISFRWLCILAGAVVLIIAGVVVGINMTRPPSSGSATPGQPNLAAVSANTDFAFDLYQELASSAGNLFLSPYSVSVALAMAYSGARGDTAEQMARALHFTVPQQRIPSAFHSLTARIAAVSQPPEGKPDTPVQLWFANALWGDDSIAFRQDYIDLVSAMYDGALARADFQNDPDGARTVINDWVSGQTKEKIQNLLAPGVVTTDTRLILTNAVYFLGSWASPFEESMTRVGAFTLLDGTSISVPMMRAYSKYYPCAEKDGLQLVELPYDGNRLAMLIILPGIGRWAEEERSLDGAKFRQLVAGLQMKRVTLSLPKFRVERQFDLSDALRALGVTNVFDADLADFSGLLGAGSIFLTAVVHKAFVAANEKGTEAAAATAAVGGITSAGGSSIAVSVDRPFLFAIRDRDTGTILFLGRVVDPR
jgi:serpin B